MERYNLLKGLGDQRFSWRLVKRGKDVVSVFSSFLTIGAVAIALLCGGVNEAKASPVGGQITQGTGAISQTGTTTTIDQSSHRIDIDWRDFSSNVGDTITFNQPTNDAIAINRVTSGIPSNLRGELNANGRIFILNNAGITFHKGSQTNVGSLIATTAKEIDIDDAGVAHFSESGDAAVINEGDILVSEGGFAVLVAPQVSNSGFIRADLGRIEMGSGTAFSFDLRGDGQVTYVLTEEQLEKAGLTNTGILQAKSGTVNLSANVASDIRKAVVNLDGLIDADSFGEGMDGGTVLVSSRGDINMNGTAKGEEVRVVADDTMNFNEGAKIEGGFAEVSGKEHILFRGATKVDKLLIDPATMTITDGAAGIDQIQEETIEALSQAGTDVLIEADNAIIMEDLSDNELTGGSGSITINGLLNTSSITFNDTTDTISTTSGDITMTAGSGGITVGNLSTGGAAIADPGTISLTTINGGDISTGSLTIQGVGTGTGVDLANPFSVSSIASLVSDGDITINGNVNLSSDATVLSGGYGEAYSLLDLRANATSGVTTVNGDVTVNATSAGNSANFMVSHSIVGIKSYDTSITGSLNQSTSLSGTYTGEAHNYLYTLINEGSSVYVPGSRSYPDYDLAAQIEYYGQADFQPFSHTSINYDNATSRNVTIGGDVNHSMSNTSLGATSVDYLITEMHADTGTFTIDGAINVALDVDITGADELVYSRGLDFSLYGNNVSLQDVDFTLDMDVADALTGNLYARRMLKRITLEAAQTLSMNSYDAYQTTNVGASTADNIFVEATNSDTVIKGTDITINGDFNNINTATSDATGNNYIQLIDEIVTGTSNTTNTFTVNGNVNIMNDMDVNAASYSQNWSYIDLTQYAHDITISGDVSVNSSMDIFGNASGSYSGSESNYWIRMWGADATYDANSIYVLGHLSNIGGGGMVDAYFAPYTVNTGENFTMNVTEGIDVIGEVFGNGDFEDSYTNATVVFDGEAPSIVNASYLNVANTLDANGFILDGLDTMYNIFVLKNAILNITNDITITNSVVAGDVPDTNGDVDTVIDMRYAGSGIEATNFIINGTYEANNSQGAWVDLEFDPYDAGYINLTGDLIINQSINLTGTTYYKPVVDVDIMLDDFSGDFTVNRFIVNANVTGGTTDEARVDLSTFDIAAQNITIANGILVDADITSDTSYGDLDVDMILTATNDITIGGVSSVTGHNDTYEGTAYTNLEMYANGGDVSLGDVSVGSSQYGYLYVQASGGEGGEGIIETGNLSLDVDAALPPLSYRRYTGGEMTLYASDIQVNGDITITENVDYGSYVSNSGERGSNYIQLNLWGDNFTTTGNVVMDTSVDNIAGDFFAWADAYMDVDLTGNATFNDITMRTNSTTLEYGSAYGYLDFSVYPSGTLTIGNLVFDVDSSSTEPTDYLGGEYYAYIRSYNSDISIDSITATVDIIGNEVDYVEAYHELYVRADGDITVGDISESSTMTSANEIFNYVDNLFTSYNDSIDVGNVDIVSDLTIQPTGGEGVGYIESESYNYFGGEGGDVEIGNFTQSTAANMDSVDPFNADHISINDDVDILAYYGALTTGDFSLSSDISATNGNVYNATTEADIDFLSWNDMNTGSVNVEESNTVMEAYTLSSTADLLFITESGNITVDGSVDMDVSATQDTISDSEQIMQSISRGIFNAAGDMTITGDFTSHTTNTVETDATVFAENIAWMMGGYGTGYDITSDLEAGPYNYYPQYTTDKVLGGESTTTLGGTMEVMANTVGAHADAEATGAIVSSSDDIAFGGTPTVRAEDEVVQQRFSGQAGGEGGESTVASLILLDTDPTPPIDPPTDKPPVVIEYTIPQDYDFSGYSYPKMRTEYVFFDWDSDELDEEALKKLERIYNEYASNGISKLFIEGHTDLSGAEGYNMVLADRRAAAASHMLHALGLDQSLHQVRTLGEEYPYVPTQDGTRLRENRRVKIKYLAVE